MTLHDFSYIPCYLLEKDFNARKNIFACQFSIHNKISLSRHEQVS